MEIVLTIPEKVAAVIERGSSGSLSRRVLELAAIRAYESGLITSYQVMEMLGFESREELFDFFYQNEVDSGYSIEDLEKDSQILEELLTKQ